MRALDSASAAVQVWLSASIFHDAVAARIANEFLYAPTRLSVGTALVTNLVD
jgi:hypothetical protein